VSELFTLVAPGPRFLALVVGVLLIARGRALFWLAVAGLGFLAGFELALHLFPGQPRALLTGLALAAGLAGALLAVALKRVAVAFGGFVLGALAIGHLVGAVGSDTGIWLLFIVVLGGVAGAVLALALLSSALMVITAGAGAALLVASTAFPPALEPLLLLVLWLLGVLVQSRR
jgi:hypothetical protein